MKKTAAVLNWLADRVEDTDEWLRNNFLKTIILALLLGSCGALVKVILDPVPHTYRVTNYNGDYEIVTAVRCHASGSTIVLTLPDGRQRWLIDVAEVEELE